ncbi:MAG: SDR family NAD(P)-dependent oxidoreductase [Azospirillaceae bacterium]
MADAHRFAGKVAIATGAARGIGRAIADRLAAEGAQVIYADIDGDEAAAAARAGGGGEACAGAALDITDAADSRRLVAEVLTERGRIDVLVNNAAILDISPWDSLDYERFREVVRVNMDGALLCTMAAVPAMEKGGGGRILMTASIMGLFGSKESLPYSTAKGGIVNMVRCLACDLAGRNITVNAIAPGFIDTRMARLADGSHEHETDYFRTVYLDYEKIPLRRSGLPDDLAGPAAFLCSDDAAYVTGQILTVDGGVTATF